MRQAAKPDDLCLILRLTWQDRIHSWRLTFVCCSRHPPHIHTHKCKLKKKLKKYQCMAPPLNFQDILWSPNTNAYEHYVTFPGEMLAKDYLPQIDTNKSNQWFPQVQPVSYWITGRVKWRLMCSVLIWVTPSQMSQNRSPHVSQLPTFHVF